MQYLGIPYRGAARRRAPASTARASRTTSSRGWVSRSRGRYPRSMPSASASLARASARRPGLLQRPRARGHLHRRQPVHSLAAHRRRRQDLGDDGLLLVGLRRRPPDPLDQQREIAVLHVGGLLYASEKDVVERGPRSASRGSRREREPGGTDGDGRVRPRANERRRARPLGRGVRLPLLPDARFPGARLRSLSPEERRDAPVHDYAGGSSAPTRLTATATVVHAGMSMDARWRATWRNRSWSSPVFAIPIALLVALAGRVPCSIGEPPATPFGSGTPEVWQFLLVPPCRLLLRRRSSSPARGELLPGDDPGHDVVLVAVAIGTGFRLTPSRSTFFIEGEVFYEVAAAARRLFRPPRALVRDGGRRAASNDAIRALLDLAPPRAVVLRDGRELMSRRPRSKWATCS